MKMEQGIEMKIFRMKIELIHRDPLFIKLSETFKKGIAIGIHRKQDGSLYEDADFMTPLRPLREGVDFTEQRRSHDQNILFLKLIELGNQLQDKWRVFIKFIFSSEEISIVAPYIEERMYVGTPSPLKVKHSKVCLKNDTNNSATSLYRWIPLPNSFMESARLASFDDFMLLCENTGRWVPLLVNTSRINRSHAKAIKKQIWDIIERNLPKGNTQKPERECKECAFLYGIRQEKTFHKYLRWYDLHMEADREKPNGYSFRAIAFYENVLQKHPEKYDATKEMIANRTKVIRASNSDITVKGYIGDPVKGEDAVEKGIKLIYSAIHRKPYPSKKTKQKEYNCPTHGVSCPSGCAYREDFMKCFNRRNKLFKPLHTLSPEVLEKVVNNNSCPKRKSQRNY